MKKIVAIVCLVALLSGIVLFGFGTMTAQATNAQDADVLTEEMVIGTWRRSGSFFERASVYVFREDGTGVRGASGSRLEFEWGIVDGALRTRMHGGLHWDVYRYTFRSGAFTVRGEGYTATYMLYSEATDIYEEDGWLLNLFVILIITLGAAGLIWTIQNKRKYR